MRQWGFQRDYIFSFLSEPGRVLTPACINEIFDGTIGPEVEPASEAVVRSFVNQKLNAVRFIEGQGHDQPISPWRIQQTLLWSRADQSSLFFDEGYETEFKLIFEASEQKIARYMKTIAAFANSGGGYIFFGVDNRGAVTKFDPVAFNEFDWDAFDKILQNRFSPYPRWGLAVVDVPRRAEFRFDTALIKRIATAKKIDRQYYDWLMDTEREEPPQHVGVIYSYPSPERIRCVKTVEPELRRGVSYARLKARNHGFEDGQDLPMPPSINLGASDAGTARAQRMQDFEARLAKSRVERRARKSPNQKQLL